MGKVTTCLSLIRIQNIYESWHSFFVVRICYRLTLHVHIEMQKQNVLSVILTSIMWTFLWLWIYFNYLNSSACSRDSRPRDWSRLGAIFMVSVSPNISRDSRDWGQPYMYFSTLQVILCQKHLFLHQLIQNMKTDCLLNYFIFNAVCVHQQIVMNVKETFWCTEFCQILDTSM